MPARANVCAMPGPMVPRPTTAALAILPLLHDAVWPALWPADSWPLRSRRFLEGRPFRQLGAPGLQVGKRRQRDREIQGPMHDRSQRDVREGDVAACDPGLPRNGAIEDRELRAEFLGIGLEARRALVGRLLRILEHLDILVVERGEQPIHPALDL